MRYPGFLHVREITPDTLISEGIDIHTNSNPEMGFEQ